VKEQTPARILTRADHPISRKNFSPNVVKVLYRLHRAGYISYLVGGAVRDLLLQRRPKDFDVGTNARPQEIRRLFRNSRIIGRRFRLVHVFFHDEIVEVSTFRSTPEAPEFPANWEEQKLAEREDEVAAEESGGRAILADNTFGNPREDAFRRDLSINALFYNIADFSVIDWTGGLDDLDAGLIRTVGDAQQRFSEDPVRMMRALEYKIRLDFSLAEGVPEAIESSCRLIKEAAPARLTYELMEGLRSGHARGIWSSWKDFGLLGEAFPEVAGEDVLSVLGAVDRAVGRGWKIPDATILAALFLPRICRLMEEMAPGTTRLANGEFLSRMKTELQAALERMMVSNHNVHLIFQGLYGLTKLRRPPTRGRQVLKLLRQDSFSTTWDLYRIAAAEGLIDVQGREAWERAIAQFQSSSTSEGKRPRRRRRRKTPGGRTDEG